MHDFKKNRDRIYTSRKTSLFNRSEPAKKQDLWAAKENASSYGGKSSQKQPNANDKKSN